MMKKLIITGMVVFFTGVVGLAWGGWKQKRASIRCLEVEVFKGRAVSEASLFQLQQKTVDAIFKDRTIFKVQQAGRPSCPADKKAMVLRGQILAISPLSLNLEISERDTKSLLAKKNLSVPVSVVGNKLPFPAQDEVAAAVAQFVKKGE